MARVYGRKRGRKPVARSKNHVLWTENHKGTWGMVYTKDEDRIKTSSDKAPEWRSEDGDAVYVSIPNQPQYLVVDLTSMTEKELKYLKYLFDTAFEAAIPLAQERDQHAETVANDPESEIILDRTYRAVPTLYVRSRFVREHSDQLLEGYQVLPD